MAGKGKKKTDGKRIIADNRRARYDYHVEEVFEAGIMLVGTEVKALREGRASIAESYVSLENGVLALINANIPIFAPANRFNHEPTRPRKLLLHAREVAKLTMAIERKGQTIVPLKLYFNKRGLVKLEIAISTGKKTHDKRNTIKDRDWKRDQSRLMRERG
ncbi:tmRNA-binding protein SmpB [hydrothermal vent metagenome]|uniref:TmRNA-binding protein SmpB n=1 Tax=hydrothermal vent metagenome TaxID=652676 RepID=A0A3B0RQ21_9ZZZZ